MESKGYGFFLTGFADDVDVQVNEEEKGVRMILTFFEKTEEGYKQLEEKIVNIANDIVSEKGQQEPAFIRYSMKEFTSGGPSIKTVVIAAGVGVVLGTAGYFGYKAYKKHKGEKKNGTK